MEARSSAPAAQLTTARQGEVRCFEGALLDLVAIGLKRSELEALLSGARRRRAQGGVDRDYLRKMLDEEVRRQFGQPFRPVLELVLNAVDACVGPAPAEVDVTLEPGAVSVSDAGEGMSAHAVVAKLLVPFATNKTQSGPRPAIGRFGVGFFSVLGFGLADPESFTLHLETSNGESRVRLVIWASGARVEALTAALFVSRARDRRGTSVRISSAALECEPLRAYLRSSLFFFPERKARIREGAAQLNDPNLVAGGARHEPHDARAGRFHLGGRGQATGVHAGTFHAGVRVEPCLAIAELVLIDFPADLELTEARDALKVTRRFAEVAGEFYAFVASLAESRPSRAARDRLAETVAQASALMLSSAGFAEHADLLAHALLGPGRFLVSPDRAENLAGFLGASIAAELFSPESFWAERQWQPHLRGERELLERELEVFAPTTIDKLARERSDLPALGMLAERARSLAWNSGATAMHGDRGTPSAPPPVMLARPRKGRSLEKPTLPCLGCRGVVLIREDAPQLRGRGGWADDYALRASFDRALGMREPDVERRLIVSDVETTGGA